MQLDQRFDCVGFLYDYLRRTPPGNALSTALSEALKRFTNLSSVFFTPVSFRCYVFTDLLRILTVSPVLRNITVNTSCMGDDREEWLSQLTGLNSLTLYDPTRAILQLLPDWLGRLSSTIQSLHLKVSFPFLNG